MSMGPSIRQCTASCGSSLDGETVVRCDPVMGYLHRSKEKISENRMYPAVIPITDRIDYMNNMAMEYGYCLWSRRLGDTAEGGARPDERVQLSHIPSIGFLMLELLTILYDVRERERIQTIMEAVTVARMMSTTSVSGGEGRPAGGPWCRWRSPHDEIFIARTRGVGKISSPRAYVPLRSGVEFT